MPIDGCAVPSESEGPPRTERGAEAEVRHKHLSLLKRDPPIQMGSQAHATWTFDGKHLRSSFPTDSTHSFEWDGHELKPTFRASGTNTYVWTDKELKPKFGAKFSNTWILKRGDWQPKSGVRFDNTWVVKGEVPVPVVAMVVHGIVD